MKCCVIVDAYRFSKSYVDYLKSKNIRAIHVQSTEMPIPAFEDSSTVEYEDYIAQFIFNGDVDQLVAKLNVFNPIAVVAGTEPGVLLADELAEALGCPCNNMELSLARRDKHAMVVALQRADIPHAISIKTSCLDEAIDWSRTKAGFPVVIKPLKGAATDGVYICHDEISLNKKFNTVLSQLDCLGQENKNVLVQAFLSGTEYMVNSVSCNGEHYITDIWQCQKREREGFGMIYDYEQLLLSEGQVQFDIVTYAKRVLNALGVQYGAAHIEIMMTAAGPILIELGARVGGNVNVFCHEQCLVVNQLELALDAYIDPDAFFKKTRLPYQVKTNARTVILASDQVGVIESLPIIDVIKSCQSVVWYHLHIQHDDFVDITRDLFSSPGKVILMHADPEVIEQDYQRIVQAMPDGFVLYDIEAMIEEAVCKY